MMREVVVEDVGNDDEACRHCGCPTRLHAVIGDWCARCAKPCPPSDGAPSSRKQRIVDALVSYDSKRVRARGRRAS